MNVPQGTADPQGTQQEATRPGEEAGAKKTKGREAFLYRNVKLLNSSITNRNYFGSGKVYYYLTGTYMNDPKASPHCPLIPSEILKSNSHFFSP